MKAKTQRQPGLVMQVCWLLVRLLVVVVFGFLISIALSAVLVKFQGEETTVIALNHEAQESHDLIVVHIDGFEHSTIAQWANELPEATASPPVLLPVIAKAKQEQFWDVLHPFIDVSLLSIKLSLFRFCILMHWLLLFLVLGMVGLFDGLSQRVIRRLSGGRESALIYHSAKSLVMMVFLSGVFLAITLPISLAVIGDVMMVSFSLSIGFIQLTAKQFKKYL